MKKYLFIVLLVGVWSCSGDTKTPDFDDDIKIKNNHYKKRTLESYEIFREKFGDSTIIKKYTHVRILDDNGKLIKGIDSTFYNYSNDLDLSITTTYYDNNKPSRMTVHDFEKNILKDIIYEYKADSILISRIDTLNDKVLEYKQYSDSGKILSDKDINEEVYFYDKNDSLVFVVNLDDGGDTNRTRQYNYTDSGINIIYNTYDFRDHKVREKYQSFYDKNGREIKSLYIDIKNPSRSTTYKYTPYRYADKYTEEAYNNEGEQSYRRTYLLKRGEKKKVDYSKEITYYDDRTDSTIFIRDSTLFFYACCYKRYENGEITGKDYVTKSKYGATEYKYHYATTPNGKRVYILDKTEISYDDRGNILKIKRSKKDLLEKNVIPEELEVRRFDENNNITLSTYYKYDPKFGGKFKKDRYSVYRYVY